MFNKTILTINQNFSVNSKIIISKTQYSPFCLFLATLLFTCVYQIQRKIFKLVISYSAIFKASIKNSDIYFRRCQPLHNLDIQFQKNVTQSDILSRYKLNNSLSHRQILSLLGIPCHEILLKIDQSGIIRKCKVQGLN